MPPSNIRDSGRVRVGVIEGNCRDEVILSVCRSVGVCRRVDEAEALGILTGLIELAVI